MYGENGSAIPRAARPTPAQVQKARLGMRRHIAAVAKELFAQRGFENIRLCDIAQAADVPGVEMVIHFSSKAHLLRAIIEDGWANLVPQFEDFLNTPVAARRVLLSVQSLMAETGRKDPDLAVLLAAEAQQAAQGAKEGELSKGRRLFVRLCSDLVARGHKDGSFPASYKTAAAVAAILSTLKDERAGAEADPSPVTAKPMLVVKPRAGSEAWRHP